MFDEHIQKIFIDLVVKRNMKVVQSGQNKRDKEKMLKKNNQ
jgi:hypothetical protein